MTLCIAAECEHENRATIVMCCDWRAQRGSITRELVGSDDVDKIREIGPASALLAGSETEADRLLAGCEVSIQKFCATPPGSNSDLVMDEFLRSLEVAACLRKKEIIEHFVGMSLGMDYKRLQDVTGDHLTGYQEEVWHEMRHLDLGADIIIGAFSDESVTVRLDRYGRAHWEANYSVIGEGADIALAFLCQQPWDRSCSPDHLGPTEPLTLMQCLYRVYEAKRAAEANGTVGRTTAFHVLIQGLGKFDISGRCSELMDEEFRRKHYRVPEIPFESSFLEEGGPDRQ